MSKIKIISDSSCDLNDELVLKNDIEIVPFYVSFDSEKYFKEKVDITVNEFYKKLKEEHCPVKTSLPPVQDYLDVFKKYLEEGFNIICFCISSKFSGSYQSALNAKNILLETYPERKIEIIDSMQATAGQGLTVMEAVKMRDENLDFETIVSVIKRLILKSKIIFTIDSLEYLQKGGRIGKAAALAGTLLNIKPIIILKDGELLPYSKIRGRKKAITEIMDIAKELMEQENLDYSVGIATSDVLDEGLELKNLLLEKYEIEIDYDIFDVGVTIGAHTGRTAVGISFIPSFKSVI